MAIERAGIYFSPSGSTRLMAHDIIHMLAKDKESLLLFVGTFRCKYRPAIVFFFDKPAGFMGSNYCRLINFIKNKY